MLTLPHTAAPDRITDTQINWLELARFAAAGDGHADLGRGVRRLATLAAAVHRATVTQSKPTDHPQGHQYTGKTQEQNSRAFSTPRPEDRS